MHAPTYCVLKDSLTCSICSPLMCAEETSPGLVRSLRDSFKRKETSEDLQSSSSKVEDEVINERSQPLRDILKLHEAKGKMLLKNKKKKKKKKKKIPETRNIPHHSGLSFLLNTTFDL